MREGMLVHRIPLLLPRDRQAPQTVRAFLWATEVDHRELRDEVVDDALASTLSYWRRKVIPQGRWNPTEGAQPRTYFVNVAVMRLVKAMGPHVRRLGATSRHEVGSAIERAMQVYWTDPSRSPFEQVEAAHDAAARLADLELTALEQRIFELKAAGLSHDRIAQQVGLSSGKAVESRVARCRVRLRAS